MRSDGLKRATDVVIAVTLLVASLPLQVLVAALIRLLMGRPILFRQLRPGLGGRPFTIVKFRTMTETRSPMMETDSDAERITRLGAALRATSLDELPTLWNVIRGDMSLVGPRPLLLHYLDLYTPREARRHSVRPGMTGLAQVAGRNEVAWQDRFDLDVYYVDNRTLMLDAKILLKTVTVVLKKSGVSHPGFATMPVFRGTPVAQERYVERDEGRENG